MLNTYKVTMERKRDGKVKKVTIAYQHDRFEAEVVAEQRYPDYAAVDSTRIPNPVRENRFPTMLGS